MKVLPAQVAEEVVRKTLQGDTISYKLLFGKDKKQIVDLEKVPGEIYTSAEDVKKILIEKTMRTINQIVGNAQRYSVEWYGVGSEEKVHLSDEALIEDSNVVDAIDDPYAAARDESENVVVLADGKVAKIRKIEIPDELKK